MRSPLPLAWMLLLSACLPVRDEPRSMVEAAIRPVALTCEHRVDPLGIDGLPPRFSWKLAPRDERERGLAQSAYRVLVASSPAALATGTGDLWDSGRVASDATVDVEYAGRALGSDVHAWWAVRVWDQAGRASEPSATARFSTGLLAEGDWAGDGGGEWIGFDAPARRPTPTSRFEGASWIGFDGDPDPSPEGTRLFRRELQLGAAARQARLVLTADDRWELFVNGRRVGASEVRPDAWRQPSEVDLTPFLVVGPNTFLLRTTNERPGPAGLLLRLALALEDDSEATLVSDENWQASDASEPEGAAWSPARVLAVCGAGPWGAFEQDPLFLPPTRLLRREFTLPSAPVRATLFTSALGIHDVELNGERVGDAFFAPGWTDYRIRVPYRAHDVTARLRAGANALGAELADGWYAGYVGYGGHRNHYGEHTRFRCVLRLEFADGTRRVIASDAGWRASTGARREADFLMGERYDARLAPLGWSSPGFDDSTWSPVDVGAEVRPALVAHAAQPIRVARELAPVATWAVGDDTWICDLGQNVAGVVRLRVRGAPGQEIVLRHGERLNPDRTLYTTNLRGARATDTYVCRGEGLELHEPRFTFHGFQYVEVRGLGHEPRPGELTALALTSDTPFVGSLETSEPALTRLLENIRWTQRMNFLDVPTDCPQRDERLGWTGDAQIYARTATWNADVQAFFTKWLQDLADAQREDGQFPMVAPLKVAGSDGGPAWADAGVICPWEMFAAYGDARLLARQYPSMQRFLDFCVRRSGPGGLPPAEFHCFGDWVSVGSDTPHEVLYSAYFAHAADLMQRAAAALGHADDAERYGALFARLRRTFAEAWVDAEGRIRGDTQCGYALALSFGLLDEPERAAAARHLVADLEARGHFSTGFVGTKDLLLALDAIGRTDLAYRLLLDRGYPSWLFSVENGATSIWERWDGWTPEKGFQDPGMNSFAHYAFGSVGQWMFETLGGLGADRPGFAHLRLAPRPGGGLTHARVEHDSIRGRIELAWTLEPADARSALRVELRVPPNVGATLVLPTRAAERVREGGRPLTDAPGVRVLARDAHELRIELVSGTYSFLCPEPILADGR